MKDVELEGILMPVWMVIVGAFVVVVAGFIIHPLLGLALTVAAITFTLLIVKEIRKHRSSE